MITSPATVVIATVARFHGIATVQLLGNSRERRFSHPRQIAYWLCHNVCGLSWTDIGRKFNRDHSTVGDGIRQAQRRIGEQVNLRRAVNEMAAIIRDHMGEKEAFAVLRTVPKSVTFRMVYPLAVDCGVSRETWGSA